MSGEDGLVQKFITAKELESLTASKEWCEWSADIGRRSARRYAIPVEALTASTPRGQIESKYTNMDELWDPVPLLSEGCAFWREIVTIYGIKINGIGEAVFPNDTIKEDFYVRYFPDDIPDEWSLEDQSKSHGKGTRTRSAVPKS